jgi:nitroreductase
MTFINIAKKRFSCRSYTDKSVEKEKVKRIIEAARIAPSANNFQPWFFYIIQDNKQTLEQIHQSYHRQWFKQAPVVIVCCANYSQAWLRPEDKKNYAEIDTAIAIEHITLQAADEDLGTCWICHFNVDAVRKILNLPPNIEPLALISLGYCQTQADTNRFDKKRKPIEQISKFL